MENMENMVSTESSSSSDESVEESLSSTSTNNGESVEPMESKIEVLNFTSNDKIDSVFHGEEKIDIIGYVDDIQYDASSEPDFKRCRFYKIVVNNGKGRRIQVTAWNERSARIFRIDRLYTLVHLRNLTIQRVEKIYNLGNVDFELLVQSDTEFTTYGRYEAHDIERCSILDAINKNGSQIRIECFIKSSLLKYKRFECGSTTDETITSFISCITDGIYMMNLRLPDGADKLDLKVGEAVSIIGVVLDDHRKPPMLHVENLEDIKRIPGRKDMPLEFVYLGNKFPKRVLW